MWPFTPAWNSKNTEKRMQAIAAIKTDTDKGIQKLIHVAKNTQYEDARQAANLRIVLEANDIFQKKMRQEAAQHIHDEIALAQVALYAQDSPIRIAAMKKISNVQLIEKIALFEIETLAEAKQHYRAMVKSNPNLPPDTRMLTEAEFLHKIQSKLPSDVRAMAVEKVENLDVLVNVALYDSYEKSRILAIGKISDQGFLRHVVQKDKSGLVREVAVSRIEDRKFLQEVAYKDEDFDVRYLAVKKIQDQNFLKEVAQKDPSSKVYNAAIQNIHDPIILCALVKSSKNTHAAFHKLTSFFSNADDTKISLEVVQCIIENMDFLREESVGIRKKLLHIAASRPDLLKPAFSALGERCKEWHRDVAHTDTMHTDELESRASGDCAHADRKEHTDRKHVDLHLGTEYLAKFPPYFSDSEARP